MKNTSRSKKILFSGVLVLFVYLFVELMAFITYGLAQGSLFSWSDFQNQRLEIVDEAKDLALLQGKGVSNDRLESNKKNNDKPNNKKASRNEEEKKKKVRGVEVVHPYIGYVSRYINEDCPDFGYCDRRMRGNDRAPITLKNKDNFIVGIFGGSFAYQTSLISSEGLLTEELRQLPQLRNKNILVHTVALGGYKQPQQLMALNYFMTLGAHFDVIVNIDGFNEVALPLMENVTKGVYPFFPRLWIKRVGRMRSAELLPLMGQVSYLKESRVKWAKRFLKSKWRFSVIWNLVWKYNNDRFLRKISNSEIAFMERKTYSKRRLHYVATGPSYNYSDDEKFYQDVAEVWARSSYQMFALSKAYSAKYFHFLQPNQYVKNMKPMTNKEVQIAFVESHPYRIGVENGYSYLKKEGKWLKNNEVPFHDLTTMFLNNDDILYSDACCHLNQKGYDLVIKRIAAEIRASYKQ